MSPTPVMGTYPPVPPQAPTRDWPVPVPFSYSMGWDAGFSLLSVDVRSA